MTVFDYVLLSLLFMYYFWIRRWAVFKFKVIEEQVRVSERLVACLARKIELLEGREKNALWTQ